MPREYRYIKQYEKVHLMSVSKDVTFIKGEI